jgi:BolA protein
MSDTAQRIESLLRARFKPVHFELGDDSAKHVGHPGATSGGGHYDVLIVAEAFEGKALLAQHRMVYEALDGMFGQQIHALALKTQAPSQWDPA